MEVQEFIEFNGITYRLMGGKRHYYLSQSTTNEGRKHPKGLHVAIWEFYHQQTVPPNCEIHHSDGNPFNNDISNLDCLPLPDHAKTKRLKDPAKQSQHLEQIRPLAFLWHKSEEGLEWHKQHGKESWESRTPHCVVCVECGESFESWKSTSKYCSENCAAKYREKTGYYKKDRICIVFCSYKGGRSR